jgi:hypothetical protein
MILINILIAIGTLTSYHSHNEKFSSLLKHLGNGYYSIPNKLGGKLIMQDYRNYKNTNDSIFFEKIHFQEERKGLFLLIGNLLGSKSSLILELKIEKGTYNIVFSEEIAFVDKVKKEIINDDVFFFITTHHSDLCSAEEALSIYVLHNLNLYKSFEGITKEEFYDNDISFCAGGISYIQSFKLKSINNKVMLIVEKKSDEKTKPVIKQYILKNNKF